MTLSSKWPENLDITLKFRALKEDSRFLWVCGYQAVLGEGRAGTGRAPKPSVPQTPNLEQSPALKDSRMRRSLEPPCPNTILNNLCRN